MRNDIGILVTLYLVGVLVGIHQPVVGNPLHGEDSLRPVGDNLQSEKDNPQPEGGSLRPDVGSRQLVEGKRQTEVGKYQVVEGIPQTVVGSHLPEVGIQGSSFLECVAEAGSSFKNCGEIMISQYNVCSLLGLYLQSIILHIYSKPNAYNSY